MAIEFNTDLFHAALRKQKVTITKIAHTPVVQATNKKKSYLLYDIASPLTTFTAGWIASDKYLTKQLLNKNGIQTATGEFFTLEHINDAIVYAKSLGFPVVIKPTTGSHGDNVFSGIDSENELRLALAELAKRMTSGQYFLVEKHIVGEEYRIFAFNNGFYAVVHRIPAFVVGDGVHSILSLIQIENYKRMNPRNNCLCEIKLDSVLFHYLEKNNYSLDAIPRENEKIQLRMSSNITMGGLCEGVQSIHPTVKTLIKKIFKAIPGLSIVGIDLICSNIKRSLHSQNYAVCELNTSPGLSMHSMPSSGKGIDVAEKLTKYLFL